MNDIFNVVTGASRGIGESIAKYLFDNDTSDLITIARNSSDLNLLKQEYELQNEAKNRTSHVYPLQLDISDTQAVETLQIPAHLKKLKALVLNAGSYYTAKVLESGEKEIRKQMEINLFGQVDLLKRFAPYFVDGFTIIFIIASKSAYFGNERAGLYAASKHAVLGLARSLRMELAERKIRVTTISPGATQSTSWEGSKTDPESLIDPLDIAKTVHFVMNTSNRSNFDEIQLNPMIDIVS